MPHSGRLTLSWVGKDKALLGTEVGGYEWVELDDPRVCEVRLLHELAAVGDVRPESEAAADNLLILGDSYHALQALLRMPEYADEYAGKVKLVYIDPPFNTGQAFLQYDDALEHSVWLTMVRDRLHLIRDVLTPDGSVWIHLDDAEMAYCRILMDEVFGRSNFVATVVWEKSDSPRNSARYLSVDQDYILVYARNAELWRPNKLPRSAGINEKYKNPDNDPRGPWFGDNLRANKPYSLGRYTVVGPTGRPFDPPPGKYWRISQERFEELDADGRIYWGRQGGAFPTQKRYLADVGDMVPRTLWKNTETGSNRTSSNEMKRLFPGATTFATPKPELLLQRVIQVSTQPGDIVMDCFAGSGTTAAVAHKTGRRWVSVERERATVEQFTRPRLEKVVYGEDPGGITGLVDWGKGGGFRLLHVGSSMYEVVDGRVYVAEWASGTAFGRAACAQLGFRRQDEPPFAGVKGRTRLAVIDGVVDDIVVRAIIPKLDEDEQLVIVAKAVAPEAAGLLAELRPGSRLKKAPRDLLPRRIVR